MRSILIQTPGVGKTWGSGSKAEGHPCLNIIIFKKIKFYLTFEANCGIILV